MKRIILAAAMIAGAAGMLGQTAPAPMQETVSVSGTGKVTLTPDRYTFTLGVQTIAPTVDQAVNENNARVANVLAALKKAGATDAQIRTSNFSIYPQQDYSQQNQLPRILGYQVNNSITVTRDKIGDAGKLLQAAISAGVNQSSGLQFQVSDPVRGRDQGMKMAFDDAKSKATVLAQAAGRSVGRALTISETGAEPPRPYPMAQMVRAGKAEVSEVPVEGGTQEVTYNVSVVFELR